MKQSDYILAFIIEHSSLAIIEKCLNSNQNPGVDASHIESKFGIVRNNASSLLNQLWKSGQIVKINSRPVTFFPTSILTELSQKYNFAPKNTYALAELIELIKINTLKVNLSHDPFAHLLGHHSSLQNQISQAKAAIIYPPKGLHTLLLGESGVGKTTFAHAMYEYSCLHKNSTADQFPFITFNCADYFNNPQLLLSQLFGHAKHAFTGAEHEKIGLVEKADGGILFLDEVHRLPPDGQEMLFYLIDKGEYSRLGETGTRRKSSVLLIAATTEDPSASLLATFMRRIPVNITLPSFSEKPISEKVEIIEYFFRLEAINLKKLINIAPEVLKALAISEYKTGNIGQLRSEIRLLCAKAFLNHLQTNQIISIDFPMLNKEIRESLLNYTHMDKSIRHYLDMFSETLMISPDTQHTLQTFEIKNDIYDLIVSELNTLKSQGLDNETITNKLKLEINQYFTKISKHFQQLHNHLTTFYKIVPKKIVDITAELIEDAERILQTKFHPQFIYGLSFHLQALLKRIEKNNTVQNKHLVKTKRDHPLEFEAAKELVNKLSEKFGLAIPDDEKGFLTLLLFHNKVDSADTDKIGIILVCHGDAVASSIASVSNALLNTKWVKAVDMPLESTVDETYKKIRSMALAIHRGKGIILMVDMGSLSDIGKQLSDDTGIPTRTITSVSTPLTLEVLHNVLYKVNDLDTIYSAVAHIDAPPALKRLTKTTAILSVCATGQGASMVAKNILDDLFATKYADKIEVIITNYNDVHNDFEKLRNKYHIIAIVGNINPNLGLPYFPIHQLLDANFQKKFFKLLDNGMSETYGLEITSPKTIYESAKELLEQYVKFINPKLAVIHIKKFLDTINHTCKKDELILDLIVHIGCMLDRCINHVEINFDEIDMFIEKNQLQFKELRSAIILLEKEYNITIPDSEICYIVKIINTKR